MGRPNGQNSGNNGGQSFADILNGGGQNSGNNGGQNFGNNGGQNFGNNGGQNSGNNGVKISEITVVKIQEITEHLQTGTIAVAVQLVHVLQLMDN